MEIGFIFKKHDNRVTFMKRRDVVLKRIAFFRKCRANQEEVLKRKVFFWVKPGFLPRALSNGFGKIKDGMERMPQGVVCCFAR